MTRIDFDIPLFHIAVSHHKLEMYENTQFPNIGINLRFREIPVHDYPV